VDAHVEAGRGDQLALIHDSPVTSSCTKFTYSELQHRVAICAGALDKLGVRKGDAVIIYMPMVPEAIISSAFDCALASSVAACACRRILLLTP
jgi:propionyl-CoA synthetase